MLATLDTAIANRNSVLSSSPRATQAPELPSPSNESLTSSIAESKTNSVDLSTKALNSSILKKKFEEQRLRLAAETSQGNHNRISTEIVASSPGDTRPMSAQLSFPLPPIFAPVEATSPTASPKIPESQNSNESGLNPTDHENVK